MTKPLSPEELNRLRDTADAMRANRAQTMTVAAADWILAGQIPFPFKSQRQAYEAIV